MRFGKRSKNSTLFGRRGAPTPEEATYSPVASDERHALLGNDDANGAEYEPPFADEPPPVSEPPKADPTQRLLTALGRFQREVAKVREGQWADGWSDECMNHLISAVEIAMDHEWPDVVEALTETARVLKSYEDAEQPAECVAFLEESSEILCLMVGDLIVGRVRPGVVQKWRECYERALEDLQATGLKLVSDPDEGQPDESVAEDSFESDDSAAAPFDMPDEADEPFAWPSESSAPAEAEEGLPTIDDFSGSDEAAEAEVAVSDEDDAELEAEEPAEAIDDGQPPAEVGRALDGLCDALGRIEKSPESADSAYAMVFDAIQFLSQHAEEQGNLGAIPACATLQRMCEQAQTGAIELNDKFFELAFAFCDAYVQAHGDSSSQDAMNWIMECEAHLFDGESIAEAQPEEAPADEAKGDAIELPSFDDADTDLDASADTEHEEAFEAPVESEDDAPIAVEDGEVELAETPPMDDVLEESPSEDVTDTEEADAALSTLESVDDLEEVAPDESAAGEEADAALLETIAQLASEAQSLEGLEVADEAAQEAAPPADEAGVSELPDLEQLDENSPLRLLAVAQRMASQGNIADAKLLALRAAARIATDEADQAEARLQDAERRLREGGEAIDRARNAVSEAEQAVQQSEASVGEGEQSLQSHREGMDGIVTVIGEVEAAIADLDAQIAELQRRREEEARKLAERQQELESARARDVSLEQQLAELRDTEEEARRRLEDARQTVKACQQKRAEIETERERAQAQLAQQRSSLSELETTIAHFTGEQLTLDETPEDEGYLF